MMVGRVFNGLDTRRLDFLKPKGLGHALGFNGKMVKPWKGGNIPVSLVTTHGCPALSGRNPFSASFCAADSRPVATLVESDTKTDLPEMTWVKITGTSTFPIENGRRIAVIKATSVEKSDPPEEAMLYPKSGS